MIIEARAKNIEKLIENRALNGLLQKEIFSIRTDYSKLSNKCSSTASIVIKRKSRPLLFLSACKLLLKRRPRAAIQLMKKVFTFSGRKIICFPSITYGYKPYDYEPKD